MTENNDTNAEGVTDAGETGSGLSPAGSGSRDQDPAPIFVSFIYDFVRTETGLGGDSGGRPGTIGGPIRDQDPKYKVFTYPFIPTRGPNIGDT